MYAPAPSPSALVGRDRELATLRERLAAALTGDGSLVLIGGEAGIGKTALAETVCREAVEQGALVLVGRCYDLTETPPYGPWVELLGRYPRHDGMPPLPDAFAQRGTVGEVTSQAALFQQVLDFFSLIGTHQPVVLLLDDLHWADPASLDLLRLVARSLGTLPALALIVYRADELTRPHPLSAVLPLLTREAIAVRLVLTPLDEAAIRALLIGRYNLREPDIARLVAYLHARGEGNALFVGELLRSLEEAGTLRRDGDRWTLADLTLTPVPAPLRLVIDGRLNRLDEESQRLLTIAAIIGQEIPYALWQSVAETDQETLYAVVERAEGARVMEETADGTAARFTHALIREALYEGMRPSRRRGWHRQVGDALIAEPAPDPDAVSYHFRAAGDARAAAWFSKAGERAIHAFAWVTATERYRAALALMEGQEVEPGVQALILYRLGIVQVYLAPKQGVNYLEEARRLALEGRDAALAAASLYHLGQMRCNAGEVRHGLAEMEAGVAAVRSLPREEAEQLPSLTVSGMSLTGNNIPIALVLWLANAGRYTEALAIGEPLLAESDRDAYALSGTANGGASLGVGVVYAARGQPDAARRAFADAYVKYAAVGNYVQATGASQRDLWWRVLPYHADDPTEGDRVAAQAAYALGQAYGVVGEHPTWDVRESLVRVSLMMLRGEWDEARRLASRLPRHPFLHLIRGPLAYAQGDVATAWEVVHEDLPEGPDTAPGDSMFLEMLGTQRLAALLAIEAGDLTTAHAWLAAHDRWLASNGSVLGLAEGHWYGRSIIAQPGRATRHTSMRGGHWYGRSSRASRSHSSPPIVCAGNSTARRAASMLPTRTSMHRSPLPMPAPRRMSEPSLCSPARNTSPPRTTTR